MGLRKKTGLLILLCCMAAIAAVVWYCLLTVGQKAPRMDGTFVEAPAARIDVEMAA